ncbi:MAG: amidohydrolase family protein [Methanomassiliicoccales archaeon]
MITLFRHPLVVTQDEKRRVKRCNIIVENGLITSVGDAEDKSGMVIEASGMIAMPGLINTHTHVGMTEFRGKLDDMDLHQFLEKSFSLDARRNEKGIRESAAAAISEMLSSGTTAFADLYYSEDVIEEECAKQGIRALLAWAVLDDELTTQHGSPLSNAEHYARKKHAPLVMPAVGLQGVYACSSHTCAGAVQLASSMDLRVHMHLCETREEVNQHQKKYGMRPVRWLHENGVLGRGLIAAHCVWLTREEMRLLATNGVSASLCTRSNMKLSSGLANLGTMVAEKFPVAIGTDSATTSNNLDMFEEMRVLSLAQKMQGWDASFPAAQYVLDMATIEGAEAVGIARECGSIKEGKSADIVLLDAKSRHFYPYDESSAVSHIVYSAQGSDVVKTMVCGRFVYERMETETMA